MHLFMYSECTNTVDPYSIITILQIIELWYMVCLIDEFIFSVFDSSY
jgi:hypothetical protein